MLFPVEGVTLNFTLRGCTSSCCCCCIVLVFLVLVIVVVEEVDGDIVTGFRVAFFK